MVFSMTGFGRGKAENFDREVVAEVKTLNHRYLDINIKLPRVLSFLEDEIRKYISRSITRGRVELYLSYKNKGDDKIEIVLNEAIIDAYQRSFEQLALCFSIKNEPNFQALMSIPDIFIINEKEEDESVLRQLVFDALEICIEAMTKMRIKEGIHLVEDILKRDNIIMDMTIKIEDRAPLVVQEYRIKLEKRLKELLASTDLDETRFNTEVAYIADKSNITEEITRLKSHVNQLAQALQDGGSVGRKLDFLVQEMNREANTIGSKSTDLIITNLVVDMKSEIEKIREQIQNLE